MYNKMKEVIPLFKVFMSEDVIKPVNEVLLSGFIGQGTKVDEFENLLKNKFNVDNLITINSATSGEQLALHLIKKPHTTFFDGFGSTMNWEGINDGDEVLTTPLTCTATNFPILHNNLKIKWVDIDPKTMNMDLDDLSRKITRKTKAIIVVHWGGYPNDLDKLKEIQNKTQKLYGFKPIIIEDAAHAFYSKFNNKLIGTHGNICSFSFQAIKHFTTVDGGMLILPHQELQRRGKLLRWYGIDRESTRKDFRCETDIEEAGFKYHMNDVNATIGIHNLPHIEKLVEIHKSNGKYYDEQLKNVNGVTLLERDDRMESSYWLYSMLVDDKTKFMEYMKECGIMVSQVHERNDKHSCVKEFRTILPNLDSIIDNLISIPVGWWVTEKDREYIVNCIKKGW